MSDNVQEEAVITADIETIHLKEMYTSMSTNPHPDVIL